MSTATSFVKQFAPPAPEHQADESTPGQHQREDAHKGKEPRVWLARRLSNSLELGTLRDHRLRIIHPILVSFAVEDGSVRACATEIDEFGFGASYSEALVDLQHTIAELYRSLEREQEWLGPDLAGVWATLRSKIQVQDVAPAA